MKNGKMLKPITGAIPETVLARIQRAAKEERCSVSRIVRLALEDYVERRRKEKAA